MNPRPVAIFDLDYTLLEGDSERSWNDFLYQQKLVDFLFRERMLAFYAQYEAGVLDLRRYEEFLLRPLTRHPVDEMNRMRDVYLEKVRSMVRPKITERVGWHRAQGHELLLMTASNNFIAEPIARMLDFRNLICTQAEVKNGSFTGKVSGDPPFREGKVRQLKLWLEQNALTLDGSWCYSDSHNDLELLSLASHPVAVTPDARLRRHARQHAWEILDL
ncbi:MAG: HAD family hydrolase [Anaerolineaceae bacterium]|jgi:HAD superfamily hydrolase (TIGR01490 family)